MSNETNATIDEIMGDIQSFACTWALVGTSLDDGDMYATAEEHSAALRTKITAALDSQARQIEALTAEIAALKADKATALGMLAAWCCAIDRNGTGWDDWDEYYKDAAYRPGPLREQLDAAIAAEKVDCGMI